MPSIYITHPEVVIDPAVPMPQWGLSDEGARRARTFAARAVVPRLQQIFSSAERKAMELAEIIAAQSGGEVVTSDAFGENDRSSTGFLELARFEAVVDRFFAEPEQGPEGWESAYDAQQRIAAAVTGAIARVGDAVFCGHGAVGTLLKCWVAGRPIARSEDQRIMAWKGGGNCFVFDVQPKRLILDWVPMEDFAGL